MNVSRMYHMYSLECQMVDISRTYHTMNISLMYHRVKISFICQVVNICTVQYRVNMSLTNLQSPTA